MDSTANNNFGFAWNLTVASGGLGSGENLVQLLAALAAKLTPSPVRAAPRPIQKHFETRINTDRLGCRVDLTAGNIGPNLVRSTQDYFEGPLQCSHYTRQNLHADVDTSRS